MSIVCIVYYLSDSKSTKDSMKPSPRRKWCKGEQVEVVRRPSEVNENESLDVEGGANIQSGEQKTQRPIVNEERRAIALGKPWSE